MQENINDTKSITLLDHTSSIVSAHLANNSVAVGEVSKLIEDVYQTLSTVSSNGTQKSERPVPAVSVKASIKPDYIVCLEDGKKLKMLKRHLMTHYNLTPEQYRERWNLPIDYPMVAPNYAAQRSALAREIGLGRSKAS